MGLPEIVISFTKKALAIIKRSSRGMALMILNDTTKEQIITPYTSFSDVKKDDWTVKNYEYIRMLFEGEPTKVVIVRAATNENAVDLPSTLDLFSNINFDFLTYPECSGEDAVIITSFIKKIREKGKKGKAVLPNHAADYEAIINFTMNNISVIWDEGSEIITYNTAEYCSRIAGILAGMPLTKSSTYYVLKEIVDIEQVDNPNEEIDAGKLIIIFDGEKYKIGRGVTSLQTISNSKPEDYKKIKIVEGTDIVKTDIYTTFEDNYVGKLNNTYDNKQAFIGAINRYFADLGGTVLDGDQDNFVEIDLQKNLKYMEAQGEDVEDLKEQEIREGNTGSKIFLRGKIKFLDAVEDLYLSLSM